MMELEDSKQQLTYILEDIRAIRSVALMADEEHDWDSEGDVVRLIALAAKSVMDRLESIPIETLTKDCKVGNVGLCLPQDCLHENGIRQANEPSGCFFLWTLLFMIIFMSGCFISPFILTVYPDFILIMSHDRLF